MITRAQIRRQLRKDGGIMTIAPREKYGLGSSLKKFVRKVIPNELAQVASTAASFVAPFNPIAAGLMAGVGGFDRHGSLSRGLRSGVLTYGGGQLARGLAGGMGNLQKGWNPMGGMGNMKYGLSSPFGTPASTATTGSLKPPTHIGPTPYEIAGPATVNKEQSILNAILKGSTAEGGGFFDGRGLFGAKGVFNLKEAIGKGMPGIFLGSSALALLGDQLAGPKEEDESIDDYMTRRKSVVSNYLRQYYKNVRPTASTADVEEFVQKNTIEYKAQGGRVGLRMGGDPTEWMTEEEETITPFQLQQEEGVPMGLMASHEGNTQLLQKLYEDFLDLGYSPADAAKKAREVFDNMSMKQREERSGITMASNPNMESTSMAQGGRINKFGGGVMDLPVRQNSAGVKELDLRDSGGFVPPIGVKEKADDIPAMLSNNEFVFTADAVRAAGGGSVEKGAQRMYDTMKKLESRIA